MENNEVKAMLKRTRIETEKWFSEIDAEMIYGDIFFMETVKD
jgi:hypothetical protein